jgi:hypothetical protein
LNILLFFALFFGRLKAPKSVQAPIRPKKAHEPVGSRTPSKKEAPARAPAKRPSVDRKERAEELKRFIEAKRNEKVFKILCPREKSLQLNYFNY